MPGSIVRPKINTKAFEAGYNFGEHFQKTISVSSHPFHNTMEAIERIDPAKKIQTLMVLLWY